MKNKSLWIIFLFLSFFALGFNFYNNNQGKIFTCIANFYYKKNDMEKAGKFYEKSFSKDYNDKNARDIYINLLINSPLSIDNQKRLINFLEIPIEDLARVKAYNFINAIRGEIYKQYPENYISNAVYNQQILHWGRNPIKYQITVDDSVPEYFKEEIKNAFLTWERAVEHQILFLESDELPNIVVTFGMHNPADSEDKKYIVAYTYPTVNANYLEKMDIKFYLKNPQDEYFSQNQIYNTALHEIAHALGFMGHSQNKKDVLYLSKNSEVIKNDGRVELSEADISTIKLLYKIKADVTNAHEIKSEYIPELVLGGKDDILNKKIQEAKNYIQKAPNLPAGYVDLAEGYVYQNEQDKAIKLLEKALRTTESKELMSMIYYNLAVTYYQIANYEMARFYLDSSFEIADNEEKHYLSAEIFKSTNDFNSAEKEYSYLISINPNNIEYTIALTNLYIMNKKYFKARKTLKNYIKKNPNERNNQRFKPYGILRLFL